MTRAGPGAATTARAILRVAVPGPRAQLFDYLPAPADSSGQARPGCRLRVPFGRGHRVGVLVETRADTAVDAARLKAATALLDTEPVLSGDLMALGRWAAAYYHHPPGAVLSHLLPAALRRGDTPAPDRPTFWRATAAGQAALRAGLSGAPVQARLLALIAAYDDGVDAASLKTAAERYHAPLRALTDKGYVEAAPMAVREPAATAGPPLNAAQAVAVAAITQRRATFAPLLLRGVTGSGKTAVYIEAMRTLVDAGQQVLVLVPEIGLTPQLLARLAQRLGTRPAVLHSGLTERERLTAWRRAASGDAGVVLGTRSAVFAPLVRPGLIIVDEEHDPSLKQQEGFRYHGRDLALKRAQQAGIPVVLGSATPSLETLANVRRGHYARVDLHQRAGGAAAPALERVDVRQRRVREGLSAPVIEAMEGALADGGQVLLFINRRGWSPSLICDDCGWSAECRRCDARLTVHRGRRRLCCHHCGAERPIPAHCSDCASEALIHLGYGTERIEAALAERFPDVATERLDRDSVRARGALDQKLERIRRGDARILLGTQMLAKGHDFPGVTLAAILDADRGLFGADFRASEHLAQTILQVAGRAGRADRPGRVLIQTRNPEHPLLRALVEQDYDTQAATLLHEREEAGLPPAGRMALIRAESTDPKAARACLSAAATQIGQPPPNGLAVYGPAPAPMERVAGRYRAQLAMQASSRAPLHTALTTLRPWLETAREARKVRWSIDVDPMEML
jgi:primosomal protein N' (replication factor Y)